MSMTIPRIEASRPEELTKSAGDLGLKASGLTAQIEAERATLEGLRRVWQGTASDAAFARVKPTLQRMERLRDAMTRAQSVLKEGGGQLSQKRSDVIAAVGRLSAQGWQVAPDGSVAARPGSPLDRYARVSPVNAMRLAQLAARNSVTIKTLMANFDTADRGVGERLHAAAAGLDSPPTKLFDAPLAPPGDGPSPPSEDERPHHQMDAFREVFGRDPTSKSDWTTAASLDPHSYDPKFDGHRPEVRVVKIEPVPGQGVVRSSQWIPDREVRSSPPWSHDLGNDRGPDANFDPEDTKVTTTIDYENGIVVMRQNPSVLENSDGTPGEVRCGSPTGAVTQLPDGTVRVEYDSGNPFAPEITRDPTGPFQGHEFTVNGDLVFTPGPDGVQVNGTRTDYPSMEVYQDMPDGSSHTVLIDPAEHGGQQGPMTNLPFHHDVGTGGKAYAPFDTGGWNPKYDVPTPLPGTEFGSVDDPPSAAPPSPVGVPM